jgi:anaerobic magnesium-protoporphyrin IX monomethyl ester cyclase
MPGVDSPSAAPDEMVIYNDAAEFSATAFILDDRSMKVLLINPPLHAEKVYGDLHRSGGNMVPLGLAYLAACLEKNGHDVDVIDCAVLDLDVEALSAKLKSADFQVAGITVMTPTASAAFLSAVAVKSANSNSKVVLGGPHVSALPAESLEECPAADFVVKGEGEIIFPALIAAIEMKHDYAGIPGLVYRENGEVVRTPESDSIRRLDDLPLPAYHLFPVKLYRPPLTKYRRLPTFSILTSRGCPHKCSFCSKAVHGRIYRHRSVANVMQELELLKTGYGARGVAFQDSTLCQNKKWVYELCAAMIESKVDLEWSCLSRVEQVDSGLLERMRQAGCWQISFGIESGSQRILDSLHKNCTLEQIETAVNAAHRAGIQVRATYMLAVPGETRRDIMATLKFAKKLGTMFASFQVTVPLPGTELLNAFGGFAGGFHRPLSWEDFNFFNDAMPFFLPDDMTRQELIALRKKAWIFYYFSTRILWRHLASLRGPADVSKYLAGAAGFGKMLFSKVKP